MRYYFAYILESYRKDYPRNSIIAYKRHKSIYAFKGIKLDMSLLDMSIEGAKPEKVAKTIGLGYADFKDEMDYVNRSVEVIKRKMKEVGIDGNC
jgi:hypothetical protein